MKLSVKNSKKMNGRDGLCWSCDLYIDGVKAAYVMDGGYGGEVDFDWYVPKLEQPFLDYVATLPSYTAYGITLKPTGGHVVSELCDDADAEKQMRRWCKNKLVFRVKGDKEGSYRTLKAPYSTQTASHVRKNYPKLEEILNERFL